MIVRRADERGHADHGWLNTFHTFSFANYYDPRWVGFSDLRVINEDRVAPGKGFGTHPHRNMEIISYVLDGGLEHRDSMGTGSVIRPGEVQVMSAGTGVTHSEFNASQNELVHFLQIWVMPAEQGTKPRYQQKRFDWESRTNRLAPIVSPDGRDDSLQILQDATILSARIENGVTVERVVPEGRSAWVHVVRGSAAVGGVTLGAGDAAGVTETGTVDIVGVSNAEVLFFDLRG